MELKDFPMLSEDVLILSTDERIDRFQIGQAIFIQAYQDEWLAVQGDERVKVSCSSADQDLSRLLRGQLTNEHLVLFERFLDVLKVIPVALVLCDLTLNLCFRPWKGHVCVFLTTNEDIQSRGLLRVHSNPEQLLPSATPEPRNWRIEDSPAHHAVTQDFIAQHCFIN
ncbi:hypothetical protein [Pseudomonas putida]|uniref:Uncharacterized protein n=1 Tax=Pseudomonas putida TaxID=303 RepID=A0A1L7NLZ8_PSEPU|nr:hypothetical protein [Pseudomonas putida]BAW26519.1 Putative uncharacterized protein [Pseudomonas putida]